MYTIMEEPQRGSVGAKKSYISEDGFFPDPRPMDTEVRLDSAIN